MDCENHWNLEIQIENEKKNEIVRIPFGNYENLENHRIPLENYENYNNPIWESWKPLKSYNSFKDYRKSWKS